MAEPGRQGPRCPAEAVHVTIGEIAKSVFIGLVNVALKLRDRWFPGETGEVVKVANCAVSVEGPAAGRAS